MQNPITSGLSGGAPALPPSSSQPQEPQVFPASGDRGAHAPGEDAEQTVLSLAGQAKHKLSGTLDSQKGAAADKVEQLAQTVQHAGEQFEGKQDWIASAVSRGAAELNTLAGSLRHKDIGELAGEVQSFAKRQPTLFIGAALAVGFAVARLGKVVAGDLSRDDLPTMPEVGNGQH